MAKHPARALILSVGTDPTVVLQLATLGKVGSTFTTIDATDYGDVFQTDIVDLEVGDTVAIGVRYDPADESHTVLLAAKEARETVQFDIDGDEAGFHVTFPALILACSRGGAQGELIGLDLSIKIQGPIEDSESS